MKWEDVDVPADLTIFAASYLIFLDAALALGVLTWVLLRQPRSTQVRWAVSVILLLGLSFVVSRIGEAVHSDPRPFAVDHVRPLIAHAADNGFPSDHALLAAAIVAVVFLVRPWWFLPFVVIGVLVDWARVGAGLHHVEDVVASSLIVLLALIVAILVGPPLAARLTPLLPVSLVGDRVPDPGRDRVSQSSGWATTATSTVIAAPISERYRTDLRRLPPASYLVGSSTWL